MVDFQKRRLAVLIEIMVWATLLALSVGLGSPAWSASITMTVDSPSADETEAINLQVTVEGDRNPPEPTIKNVGDFDLQSMGTSSQIQILNGKMSSSMIFQYLLYPKKAGQFTIGPAQVEIDGKSVSSNTIQVTITSGRPSRRAQRGAPGNQGRRGGPRGTVDPDQEEDSSQSPEESNRPYFVQAVVDRVEAHINEQITYRFQLYMRTQMGNLGFSPPKFDGFFQESLGKQREYEKVLNGVRWRVLEISIALFPTKSGVLNIEPAQLTGQVFVRSGRRGSLFDSLFDDDPRFPSPFQQARPVRLKTDPLTISVLPLPPVPPDFNFSGLVGQFELEETLSPTDLVLGDSATLTVKVSGRGNLQVLRLPEIQVSGIKFYDDEPKFESDHPQDRLGGVKTFKRAFVPTGQGDLSIPEMNIGYFDPSDRQYKTLKTSPYTLKVAPNPQGEQLSHVTGATSSPKEGVKLLAEDIMPLKRTFGSLSSSRPTRIERSFLLGSSLFLPFLYLLGLWVQRRRHRLSQDTGYERRTGAYKKLQREMRSIEKDPSFEKLSLHFRVYLGDRFDLDGLALTSVEAEQRLLDAGVSMELATQAKKIIEGCEMGQYGGGTLRDSKTQTLYTEILKLASRLEKVKPGNNSTMGSDSGFITLPFLMVLSLLLSCTTVCFATDGPPRSATFYKAGDAYERGDYVTAIELYKTLVDSSTDEGEIHYNLGNSYFRNNQLGQALFHYLMAQRYMPRDADLNYNLSFVKSHRKNQIEAEPSVMSPLYGYLDAFSPWEAYLLFCATSIFFWGCGLLLLFFPQISIKPLWGFSLVLCLISIAILIRKEWPTPMGVVTKVTSKVYSGFGRDNVLLFELAEGDPFEPLEDSPTGEWLRIRLADGKQGWIMSEEVLHSNL